MAVYFFLFKFSLFSKYGIRRNKNTNLVSILNTSYLFAFFSFPIAYNMFNMFLDVDTTAFNAVCLKGTWSTDIFGIIWNFDHELFAVDYAVGCWVDMWE